MVNATGAQNFDWYSGPFVGDTSTTATRTTRDFRNTMLVEPVMRWDAKTGRDLPVPHVRRVTITIHNLSGGVNRVWGVAREPSPYYPYSDLDRVQVSNLDSRDLGVLALPLILTTQQPSASQPTASLFSVNAFGTFAMGSGSIANNSLFVETSSTNPALIAATYSPGSAITNLARIHIGGAGEYVAVCKAGGVVEVLSTLASGGPTVIGSMNATTNPCWGIIESPLNSTTPGAGTLLMLNGTTLATLGTDQAIGTAPTVALTNLPGGGRPLGIVACKGEPTRAYWQLPRTALSASMFNTLGAQQANIYSTNLEGTDLQLLRLPISNVYYAEILGDTIIASDGLNVIQYDGSNGTRDLGWATQRYVTSDANWRIGGLCNCNGILRVITTTKSITALTNTTMNIEEYDPATGSWHNRSTPFGGATTGLGSANGTRQLGLLYTAGPGQAYSEATSFQHILLTSTTHFDFERQYVPPYGWTPFYFGNQTVGAGATTGLVFDPGGASANAQSPFMVLEGLEGKPFVLEEVRLLGDLLLDNTSALGTTWQIDIASQRAGHSAFTNNLFALFSDSGRQSSFVKPFETNTAWDTRLGYKITLTQGSNTRQTPNGLPFQLKLLVFDNVDDVRSPAEVKAPIG